MNADSYGVNTSGRIDSPVFVYIKKQVLFLYFVYIGDWKKSKVCLLPKDHPDWDFLLTIYPLNLYPLNPIKLDLRMVGLRNNDIF